MPSEVGDHCPCLCERNRFYTGKESGPSKEASRSATCSCSSLSQKEMGGREVQSKRHRRRINAAVSRGRAGLKEGSGQNGAVLGSAPSPSSSSSERPSGPAIFGRGEDLDNSSVQNQDGKTMSRGYDCISHSPVELDIGIQQLHQSHKDRSAAKIYARAICPLEVREVTFAAWPSILLRQYLRQGPLSHFS